MAQISVQQSHSILESTGYSWIQMVADTIKRFEDKPANNLFTSVQPCVIKGCQSIVYEKSLHEREPTLFHYLQNFTLYNQMKLIEDRRTDRATVVKERRKNWAPLVALGAGMMLKGTQFKSAELVPSTPHVLRSQEINLNARELINTAAVVRSFGRMSELTSNGILIPHQKRGMTINYYEYEVDAAKPSGKTASTVFSYFEGKSFHALAHLSGDQICLNTLIAGGPFGAPRLWGPVNRIARDPVQLHYMKGRGGMDGFGVFNVAYYLEYAE